MLTALHIQDFVLIERLALPLGSGLTALTGETGAGKSILLDALGLATGGRAARGSVRRGAGQGVVSAAFEPLADHPVWALMETNGVHAAGDQPADQVILRRVQGADGKSRAFVNDQPVSVGLLKKIGGALLEIHGQHDGQGFLTASTHRGLLDDFGGLSAARQKVNELWRAWRDAAAELEERQAGRDKARAEADYLRHVVEELAALDPQADEEDALAETRAALMAAEKVTEDLSAAAALLSEDGLEGKLSSCAHRLSRAAAAFGAAETPLDEAIGKIDAVLSDLMEARSAVEEAGDKLGADAALLEETEDRLFALRAAARKHGVAPSALPAFYEKAAATLADLENSEADFSRLEKTVAETKAAYFDAARSLSAARRKCAARLDAAVMKELGPLKLGKAVFSTSIAADEARPTSDGVDAVEFVVATNPGAPAGPLKTIASGGELSRFVLAMKAALAARESRTVIIFDEVDAGVGGAVADAVGERLARLAADAQVLVVTHSPQVAARADTHWRVQKAQKKNETVTSVSVLDEAEREEEIARMLSGARITDEARAAARKLLAGDAAPTARKTAAKKTGETPRAGPRKQRRKAS